MRFPALAAAFALLAAPAFPALAQTFNPPPSPTKPVDIARYTGRWYEIARVHNKTEGDCAATAADYETDASGKVTVVETCHKGSPSGPLKTYKATARILDPGVNAKMKLTFFLFISKDYWVLDHAPDYRWAILGDPTGKFLWLFSRTPTVTPQTRDMLLGRARQLGYDTGRLEFVKQAG